MIRHDIGNGLMDIAIVPEIIELFIRCMFARLYGISPISI